MNVFISQPMVGLTNNELKKYRSKVLNMIQKRYPTEKINLINPPYPYYPHGHNESVWVLGKSLEYIAQADLVFFLKYWEISYMCSLQHLICHYYHIPIAYEDEYSTYESAYYHYDVNNSPLSSCVKGDK